MQKQFHINIKSGKQQREAKHKRLLHNPELKRWFDNTARGSALTARTNLKRLGHFCEIHQTTPIQYADLAVRDLRAATDLLQDHVTLMEDEGKAPKYINVTIEAVKSWLRHFDLRINRKINIKYATHPKQGDRFTQHTRRHHPLGAEAAGQYTCQWRSNHCHHRKGEELYTRLECAESFSQLKIDRQTKEGAILAQGNNEDRH